MDKFKTDMIRGIVKENLQYTNKQIKDRVWTTYGVRVGSNEVINAVGSERERLSYGRTPDYILKAGEEFIRNCGDYDQARRILAVCGSRS
ncbi:MAG: hypothetical protein ACKVH8_17700 [Pirellulales bacterium]